MAVHMFFSENKKLPDFKYLIFKSRYVIFVYFFFTFFGVIQKKGKTIL